MKITEKQEQNMKITEKQLRKFIVNEIRNDPTSPAIRVARDIEEISGSLEDNISNFRFNEVRVDLQNLQKKIAELTKMTNGLISFYGFGGEST